MSCLPGMPCYGGGSTTPTGTNCGADPCDQKLKVSNLIKYIGPNLPCTGINNCDDLTTIIQKLEQIICDLQGCCTTSTSTTTSTTTQGSFQTPALCGVNNSVLMFCLNSNTVTPQEICDLYDIVPAVEKICYFYDPTCVPLAPGCIFYSDVQLTTPVVGSLTEICSDGTNWYTIGSNGEILTMGTCPNPPVVYQHCSEMVAIRIDQPFTVGGVTVTPSYSGDVSELPVAYPVPGTLDVSPANTAWLGKITSPFSLTLTFSSPVNNVNIYQMFGDIGTLILGSSESYEYDTNTGVPTLVPQFIANATISGNVISIDPNITTPGEGNALVSVVGGSPYTSLTISGPTTVQMPTGSFGSTFAICTSVTPTTTTTTTII